MTMNQITSYQNFISGFKNILNDPNVQGLGRYSRFVANNCGFLKL